MKERCVRRFLRRASVRPLMLFCKTALSSPISGADILFLILLIKHYQGFAHNKWRGEGVGGDYQSKNKESDTVH